MRKPRVKTCLMGCSGAVVALLLLLPLVAWPIMRQGAVEAKQKRSMAHLRSLGAAVGAYKVDHGHPPRLPLALVSDLEPLLVPTYVHKLLTVDYWGEPVEYQTSDDGRSFQLISRGWKGRPDQDPGWIRPAETRSLCYESDMVWEDDDFLVWPADEDQRGCSLSSWSNFWTIPSANPAARDELLEWD